jgi:hypothetical protein
VGGLFELCYMCLTGVWKRLIATWVLDTIGESVPAHVTIVLSAVIVQSCYVISSNFSGLYASDIFLL